MFLLRRVYVFHELRYKPFEAIRKHQWKHALTRFHRLSLILGEKKKTIPNETRN